MRTTLDLPDDLVRQAKIAAVERGTTLKELIGSALKQELESSKSKKSGNRKQSFPVFRSKRPGAMALTNREISQMQVEEDERRHVKSR